MTDPRRAITVRLTQVLTAGVLLCVFPAWAAADPLTTWDGVYQEDQAERGAVLYSGMCARCHGPQLGGIDAAPALTGGTFAANWSGVSLADMLERIRVSMPQNNPGVLSRQQVADLLAFLLDANGFPAGKRELPRQRGFLQQIMYQATKP